MARNPNDHDIACEILAEHFLISESLHSDAKAALAAAIQVAVEKWFEYEANEYRNQGGA